MAVETQAGLPASFYAGDTVRFTVAEADYPASAWSLVVVFGNNALSVAGVVSGDSFVVTIPASGSESMLGNFPVLYAFTSDGERETISAGTVSILANPTKTAPKSFAQAALEKVEEAILKLSSGTNQIVDINGQQFTKKNLTSLMDYRDKLRAEVASEDKTPGGGGRGRTICTRFI